MKKILTFVLAVLMLTGCAGTPTAEETTAAAASDTVSSGTEEIRYVSHFDSVTNIVLSDEGITVDGAEETDTVFTAHDIIYYEDKDSYESGNPYGEGTEADKHTAEEAAAHTVVNITAPGAYQVSGKLSAGQIRIDLGDDAYEDPTAVVELILDGADITCTVAPAILFLNTYECDGNWSADSAKPEVDTSAAGANLILGGDARVSGSYVAKIFKDKDGEKKLWKQDGAIYSYMSMNVFGPGTLELTAENEGLDTELHLTINGGNIHIASDNDGINTNEDGVSVTTINGGNLTIQAGLGEEGDGIDSNGYLVINGGSVVAIANPAADAGLDSDLGSYINGGTVIALGSTMDWAESDSDQVTMNLQFATQQKAGSKITLTREDGTQIFSFESDSDPARPFSGLILSHPFFRQGETYHLYIDGQQMSWTGSDVGPGFGGGRGGMGPMPEDFDPSQLPEGFDPAGMGKGFGGQPPALPEGETMPEGGFGGGRGQRGEGDREPPEGFDGEMPAIPEGEMPTMPEGEMPTMPEGEMPTMPEGEMPPDGFGGRGGMGSQSGEASTEFYMNDKVNAFSGVAAAAQ